MFQKLRWFSKKSGFVRRISLLYDLALSGEEIIVFDIHMVLQQKTIKWWNKNCTHLIQVEILFSN